MQSICFICNKVKKKCLFTVRKNVSNFQESNLKEPFTDIYL